MPGPVFRYAYWRDLKHGWKSLRAGTELPDGSLSYETFTGVIGTTRNWQKWERVPIVHKGPITTKGWRWVCGYFNRQPLTGDPREV